MREYFLNGASSYALFALYALTISPLVTSLIEFHETTAAVGVFGFAMLIAEFFALKYKLKMIRVRTNLKRIAYKKETGIDILPTITPAVFFGFFLRLVFHVGIVMVSMESFGYPCNEKYMSPQGVIVLMTVLLLEIGGVVYLYFYSDFYTDYTENKKVIREEIAEEEEWIAKHAPSAFTESAYRKELIADFVLQIFSCMIFTSFWSYLNQRGINSLIYLHQDHFSAFGAFLAVFLMMIITVSLLLRPMQIAYWIEDSLQAFTVKDKRKGWLIFATVGIFVCSPSLIKWFNLFIIGSGDTSSKAFPDYVGYLISFFVFVFLMFIEIRMMSGKQEITTEDELDQIRIKP